jgi:hypothetical protein
MVVVVAVGLRSEGAGWGTCRWACVAGTYASGAPWRRGETGGALGTWRAGRWRPGVWRGVEERGVGRVRGIKRE